MAVAFVVLVVASVISTAAEAQPTSSMAEPQEDLRLLADSLGERIHPTILRNASIDTSRFQPLVQELNIAHKEIAASQDAKVELTTKLRGQRSSEVKLSAQLEQARVQLSSAADASTEASVKLKDYAAATFQNPSTATWLDTVSTGTVSAEAGLRSQIEEDLTSAHLASKAEHERRQVNVDRLTQSRDKAVAEVALSEETLAETDRRIVEFESIVETLTPKLVSEVLLAPLSDLPFPVVVLDAYYKAQLNTAESKPQCDVSWSQLAGIGKIETKHGTYGGGVVGADGRTSKPILGPELNGDPFLAISDTEGGRLDNNPVWDHAVGPMQFIPTSWERYGADGNADGISDPHNMYDATLAAANHLCGSRSNLSNNSNFTSALFGYNRSISYGVSVKQQTDSYAAVLSLD